MYSGLLTRFGLEQAYSIIVRSYYIRGRTFHFKAKEELSESIGDYMMEELSNWYDQVHVSASETADAIRHEEQYR